MSLILKMYFIRTSMLGLVCLLGIIGVSAVHVNIEPRSAIVFPNDNITILCSTDTPIGACSITVPVYGPLYRRPNVRYNHDQIFNGSVFKRGQCRVTVSMVTDNLSGQVICSVVPKDGFMESSASMSLVVAKAPSTPEMKVSLSSTRSNEYKEGEPIQATCTVKDGRPAANITWYMDDEVILEGLTLPVDLEDARTGLHTIVQNLTRNLSWRDNGRQLKCVAEHLAYGNMMNHTSKPILVRYPPRDVPLPIKQFGIVIGQTGELVVEIQSNPQPQFTWIIGNTRIQERDQDAAQKYEAGQAEFQGDGKWKTFLFINQVTREDVRRQYYLKAINVEGEKIYRVVIATSFEPAVPPPDVSAVHVEIEPRSAIVLPNGNITILCRTSRPITTCYITFPGYAPLYFGSNESDNRDYNYYGSGLDKGQCGITLPSVDDHLNGEVVCGVGTRGDTIESTASMSLVVANAPSTPDMEVSLSSKRSNEYRVRETIRARCTVKDGRPAANITWYMDDEVILDGLTLPVDLEDAETGLHTIVQNLTRKVSWRDNGRQLKCVAGHLAYGNRRKHTSKPILVRYPPRDVPQPIEQFGFVIGQTGEVVVEILANPQPQFTWIIGNIRIQEGDRDAAQKYEAGQADSQGGGKWKTILSINQVTWEDVGMEYYLNARNKEGEKTYRVVIASSFKPADTGLHNPYTTGNLEHQGTELNAAEE